MSYFAKNNYIKYDEWFDENISPLDLKFYYEEKRLSLIHISEPTRR